MEKLLNVIQIASGVLLTIGYIPQILTIRRTKFSKNINIETYLMVLGGVVLGEIYAINLVVNGSGVAYLCTNTCSIIVLCCLVYNILKYRKNRHITRPEPKNKKLKKSEE